MFLSKSNLIPFMNQSKKPEGNYLVITLKVLQVMIKEHSQANEITRTLWIKSTKLMPMVHISRILARKREMEVHFHGMQIIL